MENKYFKLSESLYDICTKYPFLIIFLSKNGFPNLSDKSKLESVGKSLSLENAIKIKKYDTIQFCKQLESYIENELENNQLVQSSSDISIKGLLPCPVRIPLQEKLSEFISDYESENNHKILAELKAASMGVDWLVENKQIWESIDNMPDVFVSAGFDLFFDEKMIRKFSNGFSSSLAYESYNTDFNNDYIQLKDPNNQYSLLAVVPAVFLVNTDELNGREIPNSWADILKPEYENSISLPVGDFDLFNSILLHINKEYGEKAVKKLASCMQEDLHPSQMIKTESRKQNRPLVSIMPYFFTKMIKPGGKMKVVWPEDGAIISPIFMLTKKSSLEKTQKLIDFMSSTEIGEILSHQGLFPSVNPNVDNNIPKQNKFMWMGWEYINNNNIGDLILKCDEIFKTEIEDRKSNFLKNLKFGFK
ncbi:MAG: ABC transporter substrate-binding protein [Marinifilaceae bacterium]|jgi:ABC-type Fe3+ transport system substrate-binding protein|nr:ABC transporter substrate-binding protein [Marinifilaceae bacterium]